MKNKKEVGIILGVSALIVILGVILFLFLTKKKTYTVSFNTNGGREIKSIKVKQNESIGTLPKAEKEGYNFLYWVIDGTIIKEDYKVEKDITIEARYEIIVDNVKTYIITFDTDGGSEIPSQEVKENEKIKYPGEPKKDGYKFKMWVYDEEAIDFSKPITKDMTLKAEYEKITTSTTTTVKPTTTTTKKVATTVKPTTTTTKKVTTKPVDVGCMYNGELTPGVEYVYGDYTYIYKQEPETGYNMALEGVRYKTLSEDGWWAVSTESLKVIRSIGENGPTYETSTKPITSKLCKTINGKPIVSMVGIFVESRATSIDLSSFDTSNVKNMTSMFEGSEVTTLNLSYFDTSKVTDMSAMFMGSAAQVLDLSSFDTSNVTDMVGMFYSAQATIGYARTQADADRFNNVAHSLSDGTSPLTEIPDSLVFVVKQG